MIKTSNIWAFFTKTNDDKATCNECHKEFTTKQGCTSVLRKYLKGKHADLFTELERKDGDRMRANDTFEVDSNDSESQSLIGPSEPPTTHQKAKGRTGKEEGPDQEVLG